MNFFFFPAFLDRKTVGLGKAKVKLTKTTTEVDDYDDAFE